MGKGAYDEGDDRFYYFEGVMRMRAIVMGLALVLVSSTSHAQWALKRGEATFADKTRVVIEIADNDDTRQRGLMFRKTMAPTEGMIFVFPTPGDYPFWMKNTLIPLDMLWLDAQARIVAIAHSVPPCKADPCPTFPPPNPTGLATYVIELVSGFAKAHNVQVGQTVALKDVGRAR